MWGSGINYLAVIAAAVLNMLVGSIWYAPKVFGKDWMHLVGKTEEEIQRANKARLYGLMFIGALVMAFVLAMFIDAINVSGFAAGAQVGLLLWLGFVAVPRFADYLFVGKHKKLYLIDAGYWLVALVLMAGLLSAWR